MVTNPSSQYLVDKLISTAKQSGKLSRKHPPVTPGPTPVPAGSQPPPAAGPIGGGQ